MFDLVHWHTVNVVTKLIPCVILTCEVVLEDVQYTLKYVFYEETLAVTHVNHYFGYLCHPNILPIICLALVQQCGPFSDILLLEDELSDSLFLFHS